MESLNICIDVYVACMMCEYNLIILILNYSTVFPNKFKSFNFNVGFLNANYACVYKSGLFTTLQRTDYISIEKKLL